MEKDFPKNNNNGSNEYKQLSDNRQIYDFTEQLPFPSNDRGLMQLAAEPDDKQTTATSLIYNYIENIEINKLKELLNFIKNNSQYFNFQNNEKISLFKLALKKGNEFIIELLLNNFFNYSFFKNRTYEVEDLLFLLLKEFKVNQEGVMDNNKNLIQLTVESCKIDIIKFILYKYKYKERTFCYPYLYRIEYLFYILINDNFQVTSGETLPDNEISIQSDVKSCEKDIIKILILAYLKRQDYEKPEKKYLSNLKNLTTFILKNFRVSQKEILVNNEASIQSAIKSDKIDIFTFLIFSYAIDDKTTELIDLLFFLTYNLKIDLKEESVNDEASIQLAIEFYKKYIIESLILNYTRTNSISSLEKLLDILIKNFQVNQEEILIDNENSMQSFVESSKIKIIDFLISKYQKENKTRELENLLNILINKFQISSKETLLYNEIPIQSAITSCKIDIIKSLISIYKSYDDDYIVANFEYLLNILIYKFQVSSEETSVNNEDSVQSFVESSKIEIIEFLISRYKKENKTRGLENLLNILIYKFQVSSEETSVNNEDSVQSFVESSKIEIIEFLISRYKKENETRELENLLNILIKEFKTISEKKLLDNGISMQSAVKSCIIDIIKSLIHLYSETQSLDGSNLIIHILKNFIVSQEEIPINDEISIQSAIESNKIDIFTFLIFSYAKNDETTELMKLLYFLVNSFVNDKLNVFENDKSSIQLATVFYEKYIINFLISNYTKKNEIKEIEELLNLLLNRKKLTNNKDLIQLSVKSSIKIIEFLIPIYKKEKEIKSLEKLLDILEEDFQVNQEETSVNNEDSIQSAIKSCKIDIIKSLISEYTSKNYYCYLFFNKAKPLEKLLDILEKDFQVNQEETSVNNEDSIQSVITSCKIDIIKSLISIYKNYDDDYIAVKFEYLLNILIYKFRVSSEETSANNEDSIQSFIESSKIEIIEFLISRYKKENEIKSLEKLLDILVKNFQVNQEETSVNNEDSVESFIKSSKIEIIRFLIIEYVNKKNFSELENLLIFINENCQEFNLINLTFDNKTLIELAVESHQVDTVDFLFFITNKYKIPTYKECDIDHLFQTAVKNNEKSTVKLLIDKFKIPATNIYSGENNLLQTAIENGNKDIVELLINKFKISICMFGKVNNFLQTIIKKGNEDIIEFFLNFLIEESRINLDYPIKKDKSYKIEKLLFFLLKKFQVNSEEIISNNKSLIQLAVESNKEVIIAFLISKYIKENKDKELKELLSNCQTIDLTKPLPFPNGNKTLSQLAIETNKDIIVAFLIPNYIKENKTEELKELLLNYKATFYSNNLLPFLDSDKTLAQLAIESNEEFIVAFSIFNYIKERKTKEIKELLLNCQTIDLTKPLPFPNGNKTVMQLAIEYSLTDIVKFLFSMTDNSGISIYNVENLYEEDNNLFQIAIKGNNKDIVKLFVDKFKIPVEYDIFSGENSPLQIAIKNNNKDIVKLLINRKDPESNEEYSKKINNDKKISLFKLAIERNNKDIIKLLFDKFFIDYLTKDDFNYIKREKIDKVEDLLFFLLKKFQVRLEEVTINNESLIQSAVEFSKISIVEFLIPDYIINNKINELEDLLTFLVNNFQVSLEDLSTTNRLNEKSNYFDSIAFRYTKGNENNKIKKLYYNSITDIFKVISEETLSINKPPIQLAVEFYKKNIIKFLIYKYIKEKKFNKLKKLLTTIADKYKEFDLTNPLPLPDGEKTLMQFAIESHQVDTIDFLFFIAKEYKIPTYKECDINNLFQTAVKNNDESAVKLLIDKFKIPADNIYSGENNLLQTAIENGNKDIVELLIEKGESKKLEFKEKYDKFNKEFIEFYEEFPVIRSKLNEEARELDIEYQKKFHINEKISLFELAIEKDNKNIIKLLIERFFIDNIGDYSENDRYKIFELIIKKNNKFAINLLIKNENFVNNDNIFYFLETAIKKENINMIKLLFDRKKDKLISLGKKILMLLKIAVGKNNKDIIKLFSNQKILKINEICEYNILSLSMGSEGKKIYEEFIKSLKRKYDKYIKNTEQLKKLKIKLEDLKEKRKKYSDENFWINRTKILDYLPNFFKENFNKNVLKIRDEISNIENEIMAKSNKNEEDNEELAEILNNFDQDRVNYLKNNRISVSFLEDMKNAELDFNNHLTQDFKNLIID